jgi:parallel beta-helix repeat protein
MLLLLYGASGARGGDRCYVNVRDYGATGTGPPSESADGAFQRAIAAAADSGKGCGTVYVPDGVYYINGQGSWTGRWQTGYRGIDLRSNVTLVLSPGAVIRPTLADSASGHTLIRIFHAHDVHIRGGTISGDFDTHSRGDSTEWSIGLEIRGSHNVTVENMTFKKMWAYGVAVYGCQGAVAPGDFDAKCRGGSNALCSDLTIRRCVADSNRAVGILLSGCRHCVVESCTVTNTIPPPPGPGQARVYPMGAGILLLAEPFRYPCPMPDTLEDVRVLRCRVVNNALGIGVGGESHRCDENGDTAVGVARRITVEGNDVRNSGLSGDSTWLYNPYPYVAGRGHAMTISADGGVVRKNLLSRSRFDGLRLDGSRNVVVTDNTIVAPGLGTRPGYAFAAIRAHGDVTRCTIRRNICRPARPPEHRAEYGIWLSGSPDGSKAHHNSLASNRLIGAWGVTPYCDEGLGNSSGTDNATRPPTLRARRAPAARRARP